MSFLQTEFWAQFKSDFGWTFDPMQVPNADKTKQTENFILHRSFKNLFSLSYIPLAPKPSNNCLKNHTGSEAFEVSFALNEKTTLNLETYFTEFISFHNQAKELLPKNSLFLRYDLPISFDSLEKKDAFLHAFLNKGRQKKLLLHKAPSDIQSPDTVLLDLTISEENLLANMKAKWRYNIRLAEKRGVIISEKGRKGLKTFYSLYEETAKRDGIAIHSHAYYETLFDHSQNYPDISLKLYVAEHEQDILSAIICLFTKDEAVYLYGASSNIKRNLMSTYLLQWIAIQDAKKFGANTYDFYGIPPVEDPNHPMYGLYRFKTGFGGEIVHRVGSIDIPLSPLYHLYKLAENIRLFWFKKIKKLFVKKAS